MEVGLIERWTQHVYNINSHNILFLNTSDSFAIPIGGELVTWGFLTVDKDELEPFITGCFQIRLDALRASNGARRFTFHTFLNWEVASRKHLIIVDVGHKFRIETKS